jgi:hypothetical protein
MNLNLAESGATKVVKILIATFTSTCVVIVIYIWIVTTGKVTSWPVYTSYYGMLADAFLRGHTHLLVNPDPRLLELSDPYDPVANRPYRIHDLSLYQRKYYLYWGPVPALLLAPVKWIRNAISVDQADTWLNAVIHGRAKWIHNTINVTDAYLVFVFALGVVVFSTLLIVRLWRRLFYDSPWWTIIPGILVSGLGTPAPYLVSRAAVYEAAIMAGQCFLIGGIYWAFTALQQERVSAWRLFLAGCFWGLAVGSRVSLTVSVPILAVLVVWRIYRKGTGNLLDRVRLSMLTAFVTPLLISAMALGFYNCVRFGSWSELGGRYQLAGQHMAKMVDASKFLSTANILPNVFSYFLYPVTFTPVFPFILAPVDRDPFAFLQFVTKSPDYNASEAVASILMVSPFLWFALVPLFALVIRLRQGLPMQCESSWIVICLFCSALFSFMPVLLHQMSTMRYLADMTPSMVILAVIGVWQSHHLLKYKPLGSKVWYALIVGLPLVSVVAGILLSPSLLRS